jgi:hypothetical protein
MTDPMNRGKDAPIPKCGIKCGFRNQMESFDNLSPVLRDFFNDEAKISWCMCSALQWYRQVGEAKTLEHYRQLERSY